MDCPKCKMGGIKGGEVCKNCGFKFEQKSKGKKGAGKVYKWIAIGIAAFLVIIFIVGLVVAFRVAQNKEDITNIIDDALYNTENSSEENKEYVEIVSEVFAYYKSRNSELTKAAKELESHEILEFNSFKSKEKMQEIITVVNTYISKINEFEAQFDSTIQGVKDLVSATQLTDKEKQSFIDGFEHGVNSGEGRELSAVYLQSLRTYSENVIALYELLIANFDDYEIGLDETGVENIFFNSDENIALFQQQVMNVVETANKSIDAENQYVAFTNQQLQTVGVGVSAEEIMEYYEE